jgi:hypothetical protein
LIGWILIRTQEGKKEPLKQIKVKKFHVLKCWMFSFDSLDVWKPKDE